MQSYLEVSSEKQRNLKHCLGSALWGALAGHCTGSKFNLHQKSGWGRGVVMKAGAWSQRCARPRTMLFCTSQVNFLSMGNILETGWNRIRKCFLLIHTLPILSAERIFMLRMFSFGILLDDLGSHISGFSVSHIYGRGGVLEKNAGGNLVRRPVLPNIWSQVF